MASSTGSSGGVDDAVDLQALKSEIDALAVKIKTLKSASEVDEEAVKSNVDELLALKKTYAQHNDGIGVDGKPYKEPMTKAEKKAKAKAEKGAGPAKPAPDPNSANAKKKAAKKAAAKAQKEAMKAAGGVPPSVAPKTEASFPSPAPTASTAPPPAVKKPALPPPRTNLRVQPHKIVINPNDPLHKRPVVALTMAILTNTILDYDIVSDHLSRQTCLGMMQGGVVVGDYAMARYVVRRASTQNNLLGGPSPAQQAVVDAYVDYAQSLSQLEEQQRVRAVVMTVQHALMERTYLVGSSVTMADVSLFAALGFPCQAVDRTAVLATLPEGALAAHRWIQMMAQAPAIQEATQCAVGIVQNNEAVFDVTLEALAEGMNTLEGATPGRVTTRFPPEPSGYLHIGHAKAVLLNDYYARRYKGRLIVRFDDTNPSKEKEEFQEAIVEDLAKLNVTPDIITYTSDYFETIQGYAMYMIQHGLAYMDDTPQEQMKAERLEKKDSVHRNQTPEDSMKYFKLMCSGDEEGSKWCLRAKIDMQSLNGTMRDPVMYRQNLTPHHRSGTKYHAYPTYDLACPIVDSLEGVTHALRTTEYNDRDEQYQWIQTALNLRRSRIHAFSRVNFVNTVLSKRKLTWFVENGYVTGWDDPRFPTVRGVVNLGVNIAALRNYMYSQGASRRVVNMEWSKFWAENRKEIDKDAKRFMAIDKSEHVALTILNGPEGSDNSYVSTDYHPKDPSLGKRVVRIAKRVILERVDADSIELGEDIVLVRWGVVNITKVEGCLEGNFVPDGDVKAAKKKFSWLADVEDNTVCVLTEFDNLVTKDKLDEEDNFQDYINPDTMAETHAIGDAGLKTLQEHDIVQLERRGYYRVNRPFLSKDKPIVLYMIPDGKSKAMSGLSGKLGHR